MLVDILYTYTLTAHLQRKHMAKQTPHTGDIILT